MTIQQNDTVVEKRREKEQRHYPTQKNRTKSNVKVNMMQYQLKELPKSKAEPIITTTAKHGQVMGVHLLPWHFTGRPVGWCKFNYTLPGKVILSATLSRVQLHFLAWAHWWVSGSTMQTSTIFVQFVQQSCIQDFENAGQLAHDFQKYGPTIKNVGQ